MMQMNLTRTKLDKTSNTHDNEKEKQILHSGNGWSIEWNVIGCWVMEVKRLLGLEVDQVQDDKKDKFLE